MADWQTCDPGTDAPASHKYDCVATLFVSCNTLHRPLCGPRNAVGQLCVLAVLALSGNIWRCGSSWPCLEQVHRSRSQEKKHSYSESGRMKFHKPVSATWRKNGPEFENVKETATTKWSVRVRLEENFLVDIYFCFICNGILTTEHIYNWMHQKISFGRFSLAWDNSCRCDSDVNLLILVESQNIIFITRFSTRHTLQVMIIIDVFASEEVVLPLISSKCIPRITFRLGSMPINQIKFIS